MSLSVNSNSTAMAALAVLCRTTDELAAGNARVSSGLKIAAAKDNAPVYATAQTQRADIKALTAVTDGLNHAQSVSDVANAAGQTISDLMNTLRAKALAASDTGLDATSRSALNSDFQSTLKQIAQTIKAASFDGSNLLDGSLSAGLPVMASADGAGAMTVMGQNFALGGSTITVPANADISTASGAASVLTAVEDSITNVNSAVAALGSQSNQLSGHASFVSRLSDAIQVGVGGLVDADTAAESARLTALQVKQQLSAQSLSVANQMPQIILSLFKAG